MQNLGLVKKHILIHKVAYTVILVIFTIGFIIGSLNAVYLDKNIKDDTSNYIGKCINTLKAENIDKNILLKETIVNNLKPVICIWLLGLVVIGIPVIFIYLGFYGYIIGYTIVIVLNSLGFLKGTLFLLIMLLPQEFVIVPTIFFMVLNAIIFSKMLKSFTSSNLKREVVSYSVIFILSGLVVIMVSIFQTYVSMHILSSIVT
ncbi:MAG: stage II sporulation protein M [Clostridia bacterium]|nr:stage II sporulation protein M [Clostridia bacterium]